MKRVCFTQALFFLREICIIYYERKECHTSMALKRVQMGMEKTTLSYTRLELKDSARG